MQLLNDIKQKAVILVSENASTLLTAGGIVGTVATAVLTGRATFKAAEIIRNEEIKVVHETGTTNTIAENTMGLSTARRVKLVWPLYIPPVLIGSATIGSIVMANRMSAQEAVDKTPGHSTVVIATGEVLCFDRPTGRYFNSTMEKIKQAVNSTNAEIIHHDYASASFFYEELEIPATTWTDEVGWNTDQLLELTYATTMADDGKPCITIDFKALPKADYIPKHY